MNVFVLNTGRCGSTTFTKACQHISNFSSAHESRSDLHGESRFGYPENHIEADNRLSWLLGRLDRHYGDAAIYVHLRRSDKDTASSFLKRYSRPGIINSYRKIVIMGLREPKQQRVRSMDVCLDYCDTVNSNIESFLKDKTKKMNFSLENAKHDFKVFWELIGAEGDLNAALAEFDIPYNSSASLAEADRKYWSAPIAIRILRKLRRLLVKFPEYVKNA